MIIGTGTDIIKTARFKGMTDSFMAKVYTPYERAYILGKGHTSHITAAGLFAAKEAVVKALGTGFKGFWPNQVEIVHDGFGKPKVVLHGKAAQVLGKLVKRKKRFCRRHTIFLSISHTEEEAVAFVVVSAHHQ